MYNIYRHRKAMRLHNYDYASRGAYFFTTCTSQRLPFFQDEICKRMAEQVWQGLPQRFPAIRLDALAILPDHIHGIIWLEPTETQRPKLWTIIRAYKSLLYRACINHVRQKSPENVRTIWQERYHDRILDTDLDVERTRFYIVHNLEKHFSIGDYLDCLGYLFDFDEGEIK